MEFGDFPQGKALFLININCVLLQQKCDFQLFLVPTTKWKTVSFARKTESRKADVSWDTGKEKVAGDSELNHGKGGPERIREKEACAVL